MNLTGTGRVGSSVTTTSQPPNQVGTAGRTKLSENVQALFNSYQLILAHDLTKWPLYKDVAALLPDSAEKSHLLLKGAWHALERGQYQNAQSLSDAAQKCHGNIFFARLIDIELLKRQKQEDLIPEKLLEIADVFKQKGLPAQELKAYKMLARLDPNPAYYQRIIVLYTQLGKVQKASTWATDFSKLALPKIEQALVPAKALPDIAFGKALWEKFIGDVGVEPPLPPDIEKILSSPCPFWPDKKVRDTHMLVLVPQTVTITKKSLFSKRFETLNLTLKTLEELVQKPRQGTATNYRYFTIGQYTDLPAPKAHWVLMSRNVVPNSRNKSYGQQQALVTNYSEKAKAPYEVPTILDAATCIFMEYFCTGTRLYNDSPNTYTHCQEMYDGNWHLVVGGFAPDGLGVSHDDVDYAFLGVGALWKFV